MAKKKSSEFESSWLLWGALALIAIGSIYGAFAILIIILSEIWPAIVLIMIVGTTLYFIDRSKNAEISREAIDPFHEKKPLAKDVGSPTNNDHDNEQLLDVTQRHTGADYHLRNIGEKKKEFKIPLYEKKTPAKDHALPTTNDQGNKQHFDITQTRTADYHLRNIGEKEKEFKVPLPPKTFGNGTWVPLGRSIEAGGIRIKHGMVYLGRTLKTPHGENDPCLIDPSKNVASAGDYTQRQMGYWPSYSEISPSARRAYLNWLDDGRKDPEADIGYVFLFFYGLERRVILDLEKDAIVKKELPDIVNELLRLLSIYGGTSNSFRRYVGELLNWISLVEKPEKLYERPLPTLPKTFELPVYIRLALGQTAVDSAPVPVNLALAWVKLDPGINLRTPASRCPEQFDSLFAMKYAESFGSGIVLPRNRTKLNFVYRPASSGLRGHRELRLSFGEIPDVTVLTAPLKKIQQVVEDTTVQLEPYSRFIGKNPDEKFVLGGLLQLPPALWPESARNSIHNIQTRMVGGFLLLSFQELLTALEAKSTLTKEKILALARALASMNIEMEPDILGGVKIPKPDEKVVLFAVPPGEPTSRTSPTYLVAVLTLQLASAVAVADGQFSVKEIDHLREQVLSWSHLSPNHIRRLSAHLSLLTVNPVTLASLRKKLEPLDYSVRETIGTFMGTVAQSDGIVSPEEIKILEKIYKALGLEPKKVFSDVHSLATGEDLSPISITKIEKTGFSLDAAKIAVLQRDTEKVSSLLANIFSEEEGVSIIIPEAAIEAELHASYPSILGLDEMHSTLVRMLLSRPEWTRQELLDVASDLDLMLDGALERINDASFDAYDAPFVEGENPVEINVYVLEKIES